MPKTHQSIVIDAPIDAVWEKVKDFHDLSWAPNVVTSCVAQGDTPGTQVGAGRVLNDVFHETLIELDEDAHRIRYTIDEGPSPVSSGEVRDYVGHLQLTPVTKTGQTFVEWSSSWEADGDEAVAFCHGIYVALLDELASSV